MNKFLGTIKHLSNGVNMIKAPIKMKKNASEFDGSKKRAANTIPTTTPG